MINPKELRIGNIINSSGLAMVVLRIYEDRVFCHEYEPKTILEVPKDIDANPIPLTHEILEKAGGQFCDGLGSKWYIFVNNQYNVVIDLIGRGYFIKDSHSELQSVHQLQNLYFALTGEELEIKL